MVSGISNKCETKSKTPFPPFLLSVRPRPKTQEFHETILIPLLLLSYEPYSPLVAKKSSKAAHSSKPSPGFPMDIIFGILVSDGKGDPLFCADWRRNISWLCDVIETDWQIFVWCFFNEKISFQLWLSILLLIILRIALVFKIIGKVRCGLDSTPRFQQPSESLVEVHTALGMERRKGTA